MPKIVLDKERKREVILRSLSPGGHVETLAREYGISPQTLWVWRREARKNYAEELGFWLKVKRQEQKRKEARWIRS
jgi:transposase-like protein